MEVDLKSFYATVTLCKLIRNVLNPVVRAEVMTLELLKFQFYFRNSKMCMVIATTQLLHTQL